MSAKKFISVLLAISVCFVLLSGFSIGGKGGEETVDISTPEGRIANSVLEYPSTNDDFRFNIYTYYIEITECLSNKSDIVIPDTIRDLPVYAIGDNVFAYKSSITSIVMTNNIRTIGTRCFEGCENLNSVSLSSNLLTLGEYAFSKCTALKSVVIPDSLNVIPVSAFEGCVRLINVTIEDDGIANTNNADGETEGRSIGSNAFAYCDSLKTAWIPNQISYIESSAFYYSTENLTIYGAARSAAAQYAANNFVDFVETTREEYTNIARDASATNTLSLNGSAESEMWKIVLHKVVVVESSFNYKVNVENKTADVVKKSETLQDNQHVILMCFSAKNLAQEEKTFNPFYTKLFVDGYKHKIASYGAIEYDGLGEYNKFLLGSVAPNESLTGYIAVKTTYDWETVSAQFAHDMTLENSIFEMRSDNNQMVRVGNAPEEEPTTQPEEATTAITVPTMPNELTTTAQNTTTAEQNTPTTTSGSEITTTTGSTTTVPTTVQISTDANTKQGA